jgi:2-polyprenyl-3-methyl-5-hydroxy-6-metoxy-1,4-benzoquinol methylase
MKRVPEPDVMDDEAQINAWVNADREFGIRFFFNKFKEKFPEFRKGTLADLGCGIADYSSRVKEQFPEVDITGYDASALMLRYAASTAAKLGIRLENLKIPATINDRYDLAMSIHLLHHLEDPQDLWQTIKTITPNGKIFVMDLVRPVDSYTVDYIIDKYAANEPKLYREDFERSLYAAYTVDEVRCQLAECGLDLEIDVHEDDRQALASMIIYRNS